MKRDPSIHITLSQLEDIFESLQWEVDKEDILTLFREARNQSVDHRSQYTSKQRKRFEKTISTNSTMASTNLLTDLFYSIQVKKKIIGASKIKQSDTQWVQAKQVVVYADQFCEAFHLEQREGYIKFLNIAIEYGNNSKKKSFNYRYFFSWLSRCAADVVEYYRMTNEVNEDSSPEETQRIYDIYRIRVVEMTGIPFNIDRTKNPKDWSHFIQAREQADQMGVDYEDYIDAQFAALEFCHGVPNIKDLYGDVAQSRLVKYTSKMGGVRELPNSNIDWNNFKN